MTVILKIGECYTARNSIPYNLPSKFTSKCSYGSWNLFHCSDNRSEFGASLDDLPIRINVSSHICILRNDLNWTDAVIWRITIIRMQTINATNKNEKMLKLLDRMSNASGYD